MANITVTFPRYVTRTVQPTSILSGSALAQIVMTDSNDGIAYILKLVDGQIRVVGTSNGESLSQLVLSDGGTDYVVKLVGGQLIVTGTA